MESRGPDSDGVVARGPIALGHRRLSIIDLSARGAQPMVDSDLGLTLVFNGCIYNYQELRKELRGRGLPVLLHRRQRSRRQGVPSLGYAMRREVQGHVRLCRRRPRNRRRHTGAATGSGIKPLYLAETPGRLRFASTVRALLDAGERGHRDRPLRAAPLHELPFGRAGPAHDVQAACASCRRRPCG